MSSSHVHARRLGVAILAPLALLAAGCTSARGARPGEMPSVPALNVAHRGASGHAPEHTIVAYDLALAQGAAYIEQDLQLTSDGVLVVLHDATLERTARGPAAHCTGRVRERTLADLRKCDVGAWFNAAYPDRARPEYVGLRIPTLEEVLARYAGRTRFYIETKQPEDAPGMEAELLRLLDRYALRGASTQRGQVLVQSFSAASLVTLHALAPDLPLVRLTPDLGSAALRDSLDAIDDYAVGVGPAKGSVDQALVDAVHARCLVVHSYTVNETVEMRRLLALGVDGMFTNFPDRLTTALGEAGRAVRPRRSCVAPLRAAPAAAIR